MGLFEKKECDLCGGKCNPLTRKKLSDGYLCSDCKKKLSSLTDGWKSRTVSDVKTHLAAREENRQKYARFNTSATAGGAENSLNADFQNGWFVFAIQNDDYRSGNPEVFDFSQLQDFWLEEEYHIETDSDGDGIPDSRDDFDNGTPSFANRMFQNQMNNSMVNVPLAAQPFVRRNNSYSSNGVKEITGIKACFKVSHPYITRPISFKVGGTGFGMNSMSGANNMALMNAYETGVQVMQLCQQIKQGGMQQPMGNMGYQNQSMNNMNYQNQPMNNMNYQNQPMGNMGVQQNFQNQQMPNNPMNYGNQPMANQAAPAAAAFCSACGSRVAAGAAFCQSCGNKIG